MVGETSKKRHRQDGYKRRHDRNKFRKTTNATVHRKDLGYGLKGFLFSCTPHHENQCFRDGVLLLSKFCEEDSKGPESIASDEKERKTEQSLEDELNDLRSGEGKIFTRVDGGVNGAVFVKINRDNVDIEHVVESALREARQTGNPGSRHCIRLLPIYTTCYAKAEDAAKAAIGVVKEHFPRIKSSPISYAIAFRSRVNSGAKRDDFIPAIAAAVEKVEPRYTVNLTMPDVVLLVEVLKTSCCIGVFQHYYELAKMNLREAACPSKPKEAIEKEQSVENDEPLMKAKAVQGGTDIGDKTGVNEVPKLKGDGKNMTGIQVSERSDRPSEKETRQTAMKGTGPEKVKCADIGKVEDPAEDKQDNQVVVEAIGSANGAGERGNDSEHPTANAQAQNLSNTSKEAKQEGQTAGGKR